MLNKLTFAALSAIVLALAALAPAHAEIICDADEGCKPVLILPTPGLFGSDDD